MALGLKIDGFRLVLSSVWSRFGGKSMPKRLKTIENGSEVEERALRDWRTEYDKVCSLLKSDGLKFEEALKQQARRA